MKTNPMILSLMSVLFLATGCGQTTTSSVENSSVASSAAEVVDSASSSVAAETSNTDGTTTYTFEAEYNPDIEFMRGPAFSGTYTGLEMINNDTKSKDYQASNGYFVTGLCKYGQTLSFTIQSDKAVSNAVLTWRISSEAYDLKLTNDIYSIYVNNTTISYKEIDIVDVPGYLMGFKPFEDFTITKRLSLVEGDNTIVFYTNNSTALGGTFTATAPMFDCFKITTDAVLGWADQCTSNLDNK